jgi:hypothetical protein
MTSYGDSTGSSRTNYKKTGHQGYPVFATTPKETSYKRGNLLLISRRHQYCGKTVESTYFPESDTEEQYDSNDSQRPYGKTRPIGKPLEYPKDDTVALPVELV